MAWGDPTEPMPEGASWIENPALQSALLAFGANMLEHAREKGTKGIGSSIMAGYGAYMDANQKAKLAALLTARKGQPELIAPAWAAAPGAQAQTGVNPQTGQPYGIAGGPDLTGTGADFGATPTAPQLGPGSLPGTAPVPYTGAGPGRSPTGAPPAPWMPPAPTGRPYVPYPDGTTPPEPPPPLPQSPFGPGPWGGQPVLSGTPGLGGSAAEPQGPARPTPLLWPPQLGGPGRPPSSIRMPAPAAPSSPFDVPGPVTQNAQPGLLNVAGAPLSLSDLSNVQMTGESPGGQGTPTDIAAAKVGFAPGERADWDRIINRESGGRQRDAKGNVIVNEEFGATGIGQLLPSTFADMKRKYGIQGDITDEAANAEASARYYKEQLDRFGGDRKKAAMAYFAGPGNVEQGNIGPKTAEYGRAIAGDTGVPPGARLSDLSNVQLTGEAAPVAQRPDWTFQPRPVQGAPDAAMGGGVGAIPPPPGLLQDAGAGDGEGMFDANGDLTEAAKQPLRLALAAGGPAGVQQMLAQMAGQKPQIGGSAETGYFSMDPLSGKIKQLTAGRPAKQSVVLKPEQAMALVGKDAFDARGPGTVYELNQDGNLTIDDPSKGKTTVSVSTGGAKAGFEEIGKKHADVLDATAQQATQSNQMAQDYAPTMERLKHAVLEGRQDETGWWRDKTNPARRILESLGKDPQTVSEDDAVNALAGFYYQRMREKGTGNPTEKEDTRLLAGLVNTGKTTYGNYLLTKGLENQARNQTWLSQKQQQYFQRKDPDTGEKAGNLLGFDEWLRAPDASGRAPIEDKPKLYVDMNDPKDVQRRARNMNPGDLLLDQEGRVKVLKYKESDLKPDDFGKLKSGDPILMSDGTIRITP